MTENSQTAAPVVADRLDSWKEIAAYLKRDIKTVQRWEKREGMPVHRHLHDRIGSVYASRSELDRWVRARTDSPAAEIVDPPPASPAAAQPSPVRIGRAVIPLAAVALGALVLAWWLNRTEYFWRDPLAEAHVRPIGDFDAREHDAAISPDGRFVAFLSDRGGREDVWLTQIDSGQFRNVTSGDASELVNASVRTLGFSPNGAFVTFWRRDPNGIAVWAAPILGGEPAPYLEGAEFDWSRDATRLVYHEAGPGDPLFVSEAGRLPGQRIYNAPNGLHCHFPLWSADRKFIYFVQGAVPDHMDLWRIPAQGGRAERITRHDTSVSHPVLLDERTLLYLATAPDGSGPWLHSIDVERRVPHRLSLGVDRYTSLAATADARRLVATRAISKRTLWRFSVDSPEMPERISLMTGNGASPRLGPGYLIYTSSTGDAAAVWKLHDGASSQLWSGADTRFVGAPAISPDGSRIAFAVRQRGQALLYVMRADGAAARVLVSSLALEGAPAWMPDGASITVSAADRGAPRLFRVSASGGTPGPFVRDYALEPAWAPGGAFVLYSGADVGAAFSLHAATPDGAPFPVAPLTLTRGARRAVFLPGGGSVAVLRGDIQHKDLWSVDLAGGQAKRLITFAPDFAVRDFDVSADGRTVVVERVQEDSDVVLIDLPRR